MKSLFWKEWRENRLLLFLSAAIVLMIHILSVVIKMRWFDFEMATGTAYVFFVLLALIFGVSSFSNESEKENLEFVLSLPVTRSRVFWTKFLVGFVCLVFLLVFLFVATRIFSIFSRGEKYAGEFLFLVGKLPILIGSAVFFSVGLYFYSTGFLLSSLRVRALQAVISGLLLAVLLYIVTYPLSNILFGYSSLFVYSPLSLRYSPFNLQSSIFHALLSAVITVFFAYYFWTSYVTRGAPYLKRVIKAGLVFLLFLGGLYAGLNLFFTHQVNREIMRIRAAGWPTTHFEIASKPVPDNENAAPIYQKAFGLLEEKYGRKDLTEAFRNLEFNNFFQWNAENKQKAFQVAGDNKSVYLLIREATWLPGCRFPRNYYDAYTTMRILQTILAIRARTEFEQGNFNDSVNGILSGIQLAEHLFAERSTSYFYRDSGIDIFLKLLHGIYDRTDLNQSQLTQIMEKLNSVFGRKDIISILADERVYYQMPNFRRIIYPRVHDIDPSITHYPGPMVFFYRTFLNFGYKQEYIAYLRVSEQELGLLAKPYYQTEDTLEKLEKKINQPNYRHPFVRIFRMGQYHHLEIARFETNLDLAKLATALKRFKLTHGQYPKNLAELKPDFISELPSDPFTGKDFIYRQEKKGFLLYSVGDNGIDDIGKAIAEKTGKQSVAELSDIPWRQSR